MLYSLRLIWKIINILINTLVGCISSCFCLLVVVLRKCKKCVRFTRANQNFNWFRQFYLPFAISYCLCVLHALFLLRDAKSMSRLTWTTSFQMFGLYGYALCICVHIVLLVSAWAQFNNAYVNTKHEALAIKMMIIFFCLGRPGTRNDWFDCNIRL